MGVCTRLQRKPEGAPSGTVNATRRLLPAAHDRCVKINSDLRFLASPPLLQLTATTHPPGGATALIAATMQTLPKWHGEAALLGTQPEGAEPL